MSTYVNNEKGIELIKNSNNIAIIPSKLSSIDGYCAGVALYNLLKSLDKNVDIIYPGKVPDGCEDMFPIQNLISQAGLGELTVSIDYSDTLASKIDYKSENDTLYLTLKPVKRNFDLSKVKAYLQGVSYDLIILLGVQHPEDLGKTYGEIEGDLKTVPLINFDNTDRNQRYGDINVVDSSSDSLSLVCLNTLSSWGFSFDTRSAEPLLKGISSIKVS